MNTPGFTAERSLYAARGRYRSGRTVASRSGAVIPAIPACANCDAILDRCAENGGRPRALCNACASGNCYSGEENPGGRCWYDGLRNRMICDL
jgi:hypothetical protein